jgi:uncharacterized protein (DUF2252 family)
LSLQIQSTAYSPVNLQRPRSLVARHADAQPIGDGFRSGTVSEPLMSRSLLQPVAQQAPVLHSKTAAIQQDHLARQVAVQMGAPMANSTAAGPKRDPGQAVAFVNNFNSQLGLSDSVSQTRDKLIASSPAKFLRTNPGLFYQDLKGPYAAESKLLDRKAPQITIDGDAHLGNFGTVRAADGSTMWGLNDYDMAAKGSPEADLERLATSFILMGKENGLSQADSVPLIKTMAKAYMDEVASFSDSKPPENAGLKVDKTSGAVKDLIDADSSISQHHIIKKYAQEGADGYQLQRNDELKQTTPNEQKLLTGYLKKYDQTQGDTPGVQRPLKVLDMAQKVEAGGSTYGLHRYFVLVQGTSDLPVIMEIKQELPTAPDTPSGDLTKADAGHIFSGMQAMGGTPDPMMSATTLDGGAYFVREREREKGTLDLSTLHGESDWQSVAQQAGQALAKAHAHQPGAAKAITAWIGNDQSKLADNLQTFAVDYASQTVADASAFSASL